MNDLHEFTFWCNLALFVAIASLFVFAPTAPFDGDQD